MKRPTQYAASGRSEPPHERSSQALAEVHQGGPFGRFTPEQVVAALRALQAWEAEQHRLGLVPMVTLERYERYRREAADASERSDPTPTTSA